jgi:hypothetical protein
MSFLNRPCARLAMKQNKKASMSLCDTELSKYMSIISYRRVGSKPERQINIQTIGPSRCQLSI